MTSIGMADDSAGRSSAQIINPLGCGTAAGYRITCPADGLGASQRITTIRPAAAANAMRR
jgi:hypothetical protein